MKNGIFLVTRFFIQCQKVCKNRKWKRIIRWIYWFFQLTIIPMKHNPIKRPSIHLRLRENLLRQLLRLGSKFSLSIKSMSVGKTRSSFSILSCRTISKQINANTLRSSKEKTLIQNGIIKDQNLTFKVWRLSQSLREMLKVAVSRWLKTFRTSTRKYWKKKSKRNS